MGKTTAPTQPDRARADQQRWQLRAHKQLGELLSLGYKADAPALVWTVSNAGCSLHGSALFYARHDYDGDRDAETNRLRRGAFRAWVAILADLGTVEDRTSRPDRLMAVATDIDGLVDVVLTADLRHEGIDE